MKKKKKWKKSTCRSVLYYKSKETFLFFFFKTFLFLFVSGGKRKSLRKYYVYAKIKTVNSFYISILRNIIIFTEINISS